MRVKIIAAVTLVTLGLWGCTQSGLEQPATFHSLWDGSTIDQKTELLQSTDSIEPDWNANRDNMLWDDYVRAHRLGLAADKAEEYFVEWIVEILADEGFEDPLFMCLGYADPFAAEAMQEEYEAVEALGITMMDFICPLVNLAHKQETMTRLDAELFWLKTALEDRKSR